MKKITLITGGIRSGKSSYAIKLAMQYKKRVFIATATAFDEDMKKRIENHKRNRAGLFKTIEEPVYIADVINNTKNTDVCVIDCLTVWVNNLIYHNKLKETESFKKAIENAPFNIIIVSNEVGSGIVPDNTLARKYIDILGELNKNTALLSTEVFLMISGIAVKIKGV